MRHHMIRALILLLLCLAAPRATVHARAGSQSFIATATLSDTLNELRLPPSSRQDVGAFSATSTIKYADPTHWRVDTTTTAPALLQGTSTDVANGATESFSDTPLGEVFTDSITPSSGAGLAGSILMMGYYRPQATSIGDYVKAHQGHSSHAAIVDQTTLLGQPVAVIKIWPAVTLSTSSCTGSPSKCKNRNISNGQIMLWVDTAHLVPLRVQQLNMPEPFQQDLTFQVTSITYGQGPTAQDLIAPATPSSPPTLPARCDTSACNTLGSNIPWTVPDGFIPAKTPSGWQLRGEEEVGAPGSSDSLQAVAAVFLPASEHGASLQYDIFGDYLLVQEQWRATGSPPFFQTGTPQGAGSCPVWTGIYPDGTRWLGYTRGNVSLLATSNSFSQARLVHYVATHICGNT